MTPLVLSSASPRRREILETLRIPAVVRPVSVDESTRPGEPPEAYLVRVVDAKLAAAEGVARGAPRLVADTIVLHDGAILGKPIDDDEARSTLQRLSGRTHHVKTRFAVASAGRVHAETVTTEVRFISLTEDAIERYVGSGEGRDKAGAYAVQGLGAFLVASVHGSYTNVVGLPACELVRALLDLRVLPGFPLDDASPAEP